MPINAHPDYLNSEKEYNKAETLEEKIKALEKMISYVPKHKGAENLRVQLRTRLKRLLKQLEKSKKSVKRVSGGIKKEDMQAVIIGKTNSGKSSILKLLTNAEPEIKEYKFTTKRPILGTLFFEKVKIQLIEIPAVESEYYDKSLVNTADTILIILDNLEYLNEIENNLKKVKGKKIIIFNNKSNLDKNLLRKISATLQSKKYNFIILDSKSNEKIEELKNKIFQSFNKIRVYTKEPHKEKSPKPIILLPDSTIKDVAEKILKRFSEKVEYTRIWGPSSKFPGQKVGLKHKLKDLDTIEFKTK
jgi:uncharacterized protein